MIQHLSQPLAAGFIESIDAMPAPLCAWKGSRRNRAIKHTRVLDTLFRASGGNLAVAARFLPWRLRNEGRCAFLACRALDAFEDLSGDPRSALQGVRAVVEYLLGERTAPPNSSGLSSTRPADDLAILIVDELPILRDAVYALPWVARARILRLVRDMGATMNQALLTGSRDRTDGYSAGVLGRAASYVFELLSAEAGGPADFTAIGSVVQAANDLRDFEFDQARGGAGAAPNEHEARLALYLTIAEMAPAAVGAVALAKFPRFSRARAAVTYLMATTVGAVTKYAGCHAWHRLKPPLMAALSALVSVSGFARFLVDVEDAIHGTIVRVCHGGGDPHSVSVQQVGRCSRYRISRYQLELESRIIACHPCVDQARVLLRSAQIVHLALRLCEGLPNRPLGVVARADTASYNLMVSDYLLACAVGELSKTGGRTLAWAGNCIAALALESEASGECRDSGGEIAAFLATVVGEARGMSESNRRRWVEKSRSVATLLHRIDRFGNWFHHRRAERLLRRVGLGSSTQSRRGTGFAFPKNFDL